MTTLAADPRPSTVTPPTGPQTGTARGTADTLAIAWIRGSLTVASYRKSQLVNSWQADQPVEDLETLGHQVDRALEGMRLKGNDTILLLAHERFAHQTEACPSFSENATRNYLRGRVERFEADHGPVLSVSQSVAQVRNEDQHLLHLLPRDLYHQIHQTLLARHLDLTQIVPVAVPLQLELEHLMEPDQPALLMAVKLGDSTAVVACRNNGEILLTRTTLGTWSDDPNRVAVEVNRSLLYAKQQHGVPIDRIILAGSGAEETRSVIESKCGDAKQILVDPSDPLRWLTLVAQLPQRHPVNLVADYLRIKRRNRFFRRLILATCWLLLIVGGIDTWARESFWETEQARLSKLSDNEAAMEAELERLTLRNEQADRDRAFVSKVIEERLPPVPDRFLSYLASILPDDIRLNTFSVTWNEETLDWRFRIEGMLAADPETARVTINSMRRELSQSPLRVRFIESVRPEIELSLSTEATVQHFTLEGGLFEH
jgi:hypothetical protein